MSGKRKIEIFSAGCPACVDAIQTVNGLACPSCEVEVLDMHQPAVAARAKEHGVRSARLWSSTGNSPTAAHVPGSTNRHCGPQASACPYLKT